MTDKRKVHGELSCWTAGCRCRDCRATHVAYNARRARLVAYGKWQPFIDAVPAREHLRALIDHGIPRHVVSDITGISYAGLQALLYGSPSEGHPPSRRIRPVNAASILSIQIPKETTTLDDIDILLSRTTATTPLPKPLLRQLTNGERNQIITRLTLEGESAQRISTRLRIHSRTVQRVRAQAKVDA